MRVVEENKPKGINFNSPVGFGLKSLLVSAIIPCMILALRLCRAHKKRIINIICITTWINVKVMYTIFSKFTMDHDVSTS